MQLFAVHLEDMMWYTSTQRDRHFSVGSRKCCCAMKYKIAVAGTGYVGLSIATMLSQHHQVTVVDIVQEKVDLINNLKSPIQDDYVEKYLAEKELNLTATLDAKTVYVDGDFVVIVAPTNVYSTKSVAV